MRRLFALLIVWAALVAPAWAEPPSLDELVDSSGMLSASLSPDGKHIAAVLFNGTNYGLVLFDTATMEHRKLKDGRYAQTGHWIYHKAPRRVRWAGNDVLAVDFGIEAESMDLNGKRLASLGEAVVAVVDRGSDLGKVIVTTDKEDGDLALCSARIGKCKKISRPSGKPIKWAFDKDGDLRAVTLVNSAFFQDVSTITNWYKPKGKGEWIKLAEFKVTDDYWMPVYVPDEPDTIVISSRAGRDTYALFNYDVKQLRQTEMLAGHPTQDLASWQGIDQAAFDYVATEGMQPQQVWFEPKWAAMQRAIDAALPKRVNMLSGDPDRAVLIKSYGDVDPGSWYFFDVPQRKLVLLGRVKSALDSAKLLPTEVISYKAKDGLVIPAYLTRPQEKQTAAPLIVLIHGGPVARDEWGFDADVQLLASRGYAVFQPQFRGSAGFGRAFEEAGYRQWGRAMQDDITDGVQHLIKQGIADPARVCIVGASYGGYAALWGLIKTPELYKCGVSFAGVTDIAYMYSDWSDTSFDKVSRQIMMHRIGDRAQSAELFDPVSSLKNAEKIKAPVLLMHGEKDERVPLSHGKKMRDALQRHRKDVTWLTFEDEGHGVYYLKNQILYYVTLLGFLEKHLGPTNAIKAPADPAAK